MLLIVLIYFTASVLLLNDLSRLLRIRLINEIQAFKNL